jgi:nucleoside-diphosphate-sugar epimerase
MKPILVIGGNGYVGSSICWYAATKGIKIISMSRSTKPKYPGPWDSAVEHLQGDAFKPETFKDILPNVSGVIHTVGTLIDSRTPLKLNDRYEGSYEQVNRDAALSVIKTLQSTSTPVPFVFLSAAKGWFMLPGYIETKREVETFLSSASPSIPYTILRPGVMVSASNMKLFTASYLVDLFYYQGQLLKSIGLSSAPSCFPAKTLPLELVAEAAVKSVQNQDLWGKTLEVHDIETITGHSK